ncbi:hypothetical protein, partial [Klebsiella pneumoniae]|uniref:hypothetical protein n=1 Tax=Klebsiella pneumoniae TaxID=573 RepID=UPI0019538299
AFVVMDLWHRGRRREANLLFNRYCDATGDTADLPLLPFFIAIRAAVRAHVMAGHADTAAAPERPRLLAEAESYLALANA